MVKAREIAGLDCDGDVFQNIDLTLRTRLEEMCELREKALDWTDIAGVHDMRVASRRLRSALSDFAPYFDERKTTRKQLREIARALGRVRDEDVAILALEKLREKIEEEDVAAGIEQVIEKRRQRRALAREVLEQRITHEAVGQFHEKFLARQQSAAASRARKARESALTFKDAGRGVILSRCRELEGLSQSLFTPFDIESLHEMRIAAKGLRYSIELFSRCFGEELGGFAKEIAELQASLGDLHDCDVWIEELGISLKARNSNKREEARPAEAIDKATLWLLHHFVKERTHHYRDALERWTEWEAAGFLKKLEESLRETSTPAPPAQGREDAPAESMNT